jgi:hypothetical protein
MEEEGHYQDLEGFRHIAKLLASPGKGIEAIELQGLQDTDVAKANKNMQPQLGLDKEAKKHAGEAIARLEERIAEERKAGNLDHVWELQDKCNKLRRYLEEGQRRMLGSPPPRERARKAVCNAVKRAKVKLTAKMPRFGQFLDQSVLFKNNAWIYSPLQPAPTWIL